MAQLYFKLGFQEKKAQFDHFFRSYPNYGSHKAGYCINAGLEWLIDWMKNSYFRDKDIEILRRQKSQRGNPIFQEDFLQWLKKNGSFEGITITAIPEGRVVHPNVPLTVVRGPMSMAQILETPLLNQLNYQTLIATKASRIFEMGKRQPLIDFGTRRAQDRGAIAGVRGALIGGADFSSNVGISHVLGYPPKGTHAHSMVQLFLALGMSEYDAFESFAELYPDDCILLVDTINTLESGIPNAIKIFNKLKKKGHNPIGIRLDSGDLAYLSIKSAKMLNDAGLKEIKIVLSNELDEMNIWQIMTQIIEEAPKSGVDPDDVIKRLIYGVGTRLITSAGDSALDGVYKLVAVDKDGEWQPAIKISEIREKIPSPGNKKFWRIYDNGNKATADLINLENENPGEMNEVKLLHPSDHTKRRLLTRNQISMIESLHLQILNEGKIVYDFPSINEIRKTREKDIDSLDSGVKRLILPHTYHVSISEKLWNLKEGLIQSVKANS